MTEEIPTKRGEAAWKEQRDAISQRNAGARKEAQVEQKSRERAVDGRIREHAQREQEQLRALNARLDRQRAAGGR